MRCEDPEGFPTRFYRRADDRGSLDGDRHSFTPTARGNYPVAILGSDGTGAFSSKKVVIEVP